MSGPPVRIVEWDADREVCLAGRDGEPSLVWVQDFADAWQAAISRGVELVVPMPVYEEWVADGEAPPEPPIGVSIE